MFTLSKVEKQKWLWLSQDLKLTDLYKMLHAKENENIYRGAQVLLLLSF